MPAVFKGVEVESQIVSEQQSALDEDLTAEEEAYLELLED